MTVPYNDESRESYIKREKATHLHIAEVHHRLGNKRSTWLALLYWAMSDDIYGEHWDKIVGDRKSVAKFKEEWNRKQNERAQETQT